MFGASTVAQESTVEMWLPVIGRALAQICLHVGGVEDQTIGEKAAILESLGLPRKDVASMLGTTVQSVAELVGRAKRGKSKRKRGRPKKA
jgi:hypothetical protein